MRRPSLAYHVALLLALGCAGLAGAQEKRSDTLLTVDHYLDFEQVGDPQISPDGKQIVYTRRYVNKIDDRVGFGALDHECRRLAQSHARQRRERRVVARRDTSRLPRRRRSA